MAILSEFDLDLPYRKNIDVISGLMSEKNIDEHEATKLDYESNWKGKRNQFRLQTRCISAFFERLFGTFQTDDCWKVLIECVEGDESPRVLNLSGVVSVEVQINFDNFDCSNDYNKKRLALEFMNKGIEKIRREKGWGGELFSSASSQIRELNYENKWMWKKPLASPTRKYTAEIVCEHTLEALNINLIIRNQEQKNLKQVQLISEQPDEFFFMEHLGKLSWLSESNVALINKEGTNRWGVSI